MPTNILRFSGSIELSPEDIGKLVMMKDLEVRLVGEIRSVAEVATDSEEKKMVYKLRVSEVKAIQ